MIKRTYPNEAKMHSNPITPTKKSSTNFDLHFLLILKGKTKNSHFKKPNPIYTFFSWHYSIFRTFLAHARALLYIFLFGSPRGRPKNQNFSWRPLCGLRNFKINFKILHWWASLHQLSVVGFFALRHFYKFSLRQKCITKFFFLLDKPLSEWYNVMERRFLLWKM